jgi:hypothetical protein
MPPVFCAYPLHIAAASTQICQELRLGNVDAALDMINVIADPNHRRLIKSLFHDVSNGLNITSEVVGVLQVELDHLRVKQRKLSELPLASVRDRLAASFDITQHLLSLPRIVHQTFYPRLPSSSNHK